MQIAHYDGIERTSDSRGHCWLLLPPLVGIARLLRHYGLAFTRLKADTATATGCKHTVYLCRLGRHASVTNCRRSTCNKDIYISELQFMLPQEASVIYTILNTSYGKLPALGILVLSSNYYTRRSTSS